MPLPRLPRTNSSKLQLPDTLRYKNRPFRAMNQETLGKNKSAPQIYNAPSQNYWPLKTALNEVFSPKQTDVTLLTK